MDSSGVSSSASKRQGTSNTGTDYSRRSAVSEAKTVDEAYYPADRSPPQSFVFDPARESLKSCATVAMAFGILICVPMAFVLTNRLAFDQPECLPLQPGEAREKCEPCSSGTWIAPLGGEMEQSWPKTLRALIYFITLVWCFLGVAIVCDHFMAAIEEITSRKRYMWIEGAGNSRYKVWYRIWNDTMANLTLMALGSSAPEILLSCVELIGNNMLSGRLGPSTIVGSAAFNLLIITAVCIAAVPDPRVSSIDQLEVFTVTATFSIVAYLWLVFILELNTPDKVDIWEAFVTLGQFPLLLVVSFAADKGLLGGFRCHWHTAIVQMHRRKSLHERGQVTEEEVAEAQRQLKAKFGKTVRGEHVRVLLESKARQEAFAYYESKQNMLPTTSSARLFHRRSVMSRITGTGSQRSNASRGKNDDSISIGFIARRHVVLECAGKVAVPVRASRAPDCVVELAYRTHDQDAIAGERYQHVEGVLRFEPTETERFIEIPIIDNDTWEPTQVFTVELSDLTLLLGDIRFQTNGQKSRRYVLKNALTKVAILNDEEPGTISFQNFEINALKNADSITVVVDRSDGDFGEVIVKYETRDGFANCKEDYEHVEGELRFLPQEAQQLITVPLNVDRPRHWDDRSFYVVLTSPTQGVRFDPETPGGDSSAICEVVLGGEPHGLLRLEIFLARQFSRRKCCRGMHEWYDQFVEAVYCNGNPLEQSQASTSEWVFHVLAVVWKVFFALVPPPILLGGWLCFTVSLAMIGLLTAIVSDLAALLGCCVGLPEEICALTIVALGTSLPDTFASLSAARSNDSADSSVGNVTGSNSVNVFLGLGLPWVLGSLYWEAQGKTDLWRNAYYKGMTYEEAWGAKYQSGGMLVPAGSFSFSVILFTSTAAVCIMVLMIRRCRYGGELGGPKAAQLRDACILVTLWVCYIGTSCVKFMSDED